MKKSDLQLFLGEKITLSKLPKEAKLQLLNYIQTEANIHQLMALALDGKIMTVDDDTTRQIIEARFNTVNSLSEFTGPISMIKRMKDCMLQCKGKSGQEKSLCKVKCKAAWKKKMKAAKIAGKRSGNAAINAAREQSEIEGADSIDTLAEAFEFLGALDSVGSHIQAALKSCKSVTCYKVLPAQKKECNIKCRATVADKAVTKLTAAKSRCRQAKKPDKCAARFDKVINRWKKEKENQLEKLKKLKK